MILNIWKLENSTFTKTAVIDYATSVIWVKRFNAAGQFELYIRASADLLQLFQGDIFITRDDSSAVMYAEKIQLNTDDENGDYLTITGRSAECILGRRIIQRITFRSTTAETIIRTLVNSNVISPAMGSENRKIDFVSLAPANGWTESLEKQITGKNLLTAISDLCIQFNYGFEMLFTGTGFVFSLYKGTDRSFDQSENTFVVFSPEFENLGNTEYTHDTATYYNAAVVGGQGEGTDRIFVTVTTPGMTGFQRREMFVDARQTSNKTNSGELPIADYQELLKEQGREQLNLAKITTTFNGETLNYNAYTYGVDYNLGDKVSIKNEYGITGNSTITEITEVEDETGYRLIPTFSEWEITETEG